jgi:YVTN family beta-propeller protein
MNPHSWRLVPALFLWLIVVHTARGQSVVGTVGVGQTPVAIAVNTVTNKIYVVNQTDNDVTVIDGATSATLTVSVGANPVAVAVNTLTNKVYVVNNIGLFGSNGTVTVIDGATNNTSTVSVGGNPQAVAVNPMTNKIYVVNNGFGSNGTVTVIDGATNSTSTVMVGGDPLSLAVNSVTNKIYVVNNCGPNISSCGQPGSVTVIDGTNNSTSTVSVGTSPVGIAVNPSTNKIYVANLTSLDVTVIIGVTAGVTRVGIGAVPYAIAVNTSTNKIYVADANSGAVTLIDGATNSTSTINVAPSPVGLAVNEVTNQIFVIHNTQSNNVTIIDGATNSTAVLSAGTYPHEIAINSGTNKAYVGNIGSNDVTVLGLPASSCPDATFAGIVRNGVTQPNVSPGHISASFQPGCGFSLNGAARLGGYDHFNWVQVITLDTLIMDCPLCAVLGGLTYFPPGNLVPVLPQIPYFDTPPGGYVYEGASPFGPVEDNLNWYEDELYTPGPPFVKGDASRGMCTQLQVAENADLHCSTGNSRVLGFEDMPECQITTVGFVCTVNFSTTLVGVRSDGTGDALNFGACNTGIVPTCQNISGTSFSWHVVGTTIGVDQRRQNFQPDPGTLVFFDGFKTLGAAGFSQPELELFAKSGTNVRDESGVTTPVIIDIKPGGFPNSINAQSSGKIPVAIISTTGFQVPSQVDQNSLTFGHTGDEPSLASCHSEDVNGDGLMDLVCQFYTSLAAFQPGDAAGVLKGKTLSGVPLYGKDSVQIVPPKKSKIG